MEGLGVPDWDDYVDGRFGSGLSLFGTLVSKSFFNHAKDPLIVNIDSFWVLGLLL